MKTRIIVYTLFISSICFSQSKEIVILDKVTQKPIDLVQIFYSDLEIGSISNEDGIIKIPLKESKIKVSHLNYNEQELSFKDFKVKDTLFLIPKANELDEIVIHNVDLKQRLKKMFDNYLDEYSVKKIIHSSTYKETFSVNDSLTRLFQVQLEWYSKNSLFKRDTELSKQNIINIKSIDYSKKNEIKTDFIDPNGGYVKNESFFMFLHLNFLLETLIYATHDYEIVSIDKNDKEVRVYFNATFKEKGEEIFRHENSLIVFTKDYKSIKKLKFNMIYSQDFEDAKSRIKKLPYKKKTKSHSIELSFRKLKNDKYSISYFTSELKAAIKTANYKGNIVAKQGLFVNESKLGKKLKNGNLDLSKPFYESVPQNLKKDGVKILLSKREKAFFKD